MWTGASGLMSSNANSSSSSCTRLAGISPAAILQNKHDMKASIARSIGDTDVSGIDVLLDAAADVNIDGLAVETAHGKTVITGTACYQLDRERLFDAVKQLDGWESDVVFEVSVERQDARGYHIVREGDTLASIAQQYLGAASREMEIFEANRDRMNDPGQILPGQQLLIPWR